MEIPSIYEQSFKDAYKHPPHYREDLTIERLLQGKIDKGFYIDIGAHDPLRNSNGHQFYIKGWRGIDVEPTSYFAQKLKFFHPENIVIEAAIGSYEGLIDFYIPDVEPMHWQIATTKPAWVEWNKQRVPGEEWKQISVHQITLDNVFEKCPKEIDIDFISIDVEGAEYEVLQGWDVAKYRPKIICIESVVSAETPRFNIWEPKLLSYYAFAHFDGCNRFYVRT